MASVQSNRHDTRKCFPLLARDTSMFGGVQRRGLPLTNVGHPEAASTSMYGVFFLCFFQV